MPASLSPSVVTPLTPIQLYELFYTASGGASSWAIAMGAVALRESRGIPSVRNVNGKTGDRSYGLVQINMLNPEVAKYLNAGILKGKPEILLLEPEVNAAAAWALTCSTPAHLANMNLLWYVERTDGTYKADWESHLPVMILAALQSKLGWASGAPSPVVS